MRFVEHRKKYAEFKLFHVKKNLIQSQSITEKNCKNQLLFLCKALSYKLN